MPIYHRLKRTRPLNATELTRRLIEEWESPKDTGQPAILIEGNSGKPTHIYVIWDEWGGLSQAERSEIIMDALEHSSGNGRLEDLSLVTVAMGLTTEEASRMGIEPA